MSCKYCTQLTFQELRLLKLRYREKKTFKEIGEFLYQYSHEDGEYCSGCKKAYSISYVISRHRKALRKLYILEWTHPDFIKEELLLMENIREKT